MLSAVVLLKIVSLLDEYQNLSTLLEAESSDATLSRLEEVQSAITALGGWELEAQIDDLVARLELESETPFSSLSGGARRRAWLGRALSAKPRVLLLDEPTNHLDIASIEWLEKFLKGTLVPCFS